MLPASKEQPGKLAVPVEKVARLIRAFSRHDKAKLLQLVPELQIIRAEEADLPAEQAELMAYFQSKIEALPPDYHPMLEDDIFLNDMTVSEFFALPELEQVRLWQEAHLAAERELAHQE